MKNKRVEFRCTDDEYEELQTLAGTLGVPSVARAIRKQCGLGDESVRPAPERVMVKARHDGDQVIDAAPAETAQALDTSKDFKQMVARLQAKMSLEQAEEEARRRLS